MHEGFLFENNSTHQAPRTDETTVYTNQHCPRVIIQVVVSILSFLASLLVSISVAAGGKDNTKNAENTRSTESTCRLLPLGLLKNTYRRIIFGLCLADMFLSNSLAIGPLAVPKHSVFAYWGKGNTMSCNFAGLSLMAGSIMSPMYTTFLCYYYKKKLSDRGSILKTREVAIHLCIWCSAIIILSVSLYTGSINPAPSGAHCGPVLKPTGCTAHPEIFGECENVESVTAINGIVFGIFLISLVFIVIFMAFITMHVCRESKKYQNISGEHLRSIPSEDREQEDEEQRRSYVLKEKAENLRRLYLQTALVQAFLFVISFVLTNATYVYVAAFSVMRKKLTITEMNPVIYYIATVLYSSTGIINILVFTRPGIVFLRQEKTEYSFCTLLYLILRNGGEVPKDLLKSENEEGQAEQIDSVAYGVEGIYIPSGIQSSEDCRFVSLDMAVKSSDKQSSVTIKKIGTSLKQEEYEWYNCFPLQLPSSSDETIKCNNQENWYKVEARRV